MSTTKVYLHQHKLMNAKNQVMYYVGIIHFLEFSDLVVRIIKLKINYIQGYCLNIELIVSPQKRKRLYTLGESFRFSFYSLKT